MYLYLYIERLNGPLFQIHGSIIRAIQTDVELIGYLGVLSACIFPVRTATRLNSARKLQQKLVLWNIYRPNVLQWGRLNASGTVVNSCRERRYLTSFMRLPNFYAIARRAIAQLQHFTIRQEHKLRTLNHYKDWRLWIKCAQHNIDPI